MESKKNSNTKKFIICLTLYIISVFFLVLFTAMPDFPKSIGTDYIILACIGSLFACFLVSDKILSKDIKDIKK